MKLARIVSKSALGMVAGLAFFVGGCQDASGPESPKTGAVTAQGTAVYSEVLRLPDRGVWRTSKTSRSDSGSGAVACAANSNGKTECRQSFTLKAELGSDTLLQDVYAMGVQFATVKYSQTISQTELTYESAALLPMEEKLIRTFNAAFKQSHPGQKPTASDLTAFYAELLLSGDSTVTGKPLPRGMSMDSARKALVLVASQKNVTATALVSRSLLELSVETIRSITAVLVKASAVKDSTVLFPLPAVRVVDSVKVAGDLVVGGNPVAVTGEFAWSTKGSVDNPEVSVRNSQGIESHVQVRFDELPALNSGSWALKGKLTLQANKGARIGLDTLVVALVGDSGRATSRTTFRVTAGDTIPPRLDIVSPPNDTLVPNSTSSIVLRAEASDNKGLAYVKIGSQKLTSAPYVDSLDLAVGRNILAVEAVDLAGNVSTDTVLVIRTKSTTNTDTTDPVVTLRSPSRDTTVAVGHPNFEITWTASDDVGLRKVTLNDSEITGESGFYKKTASLHDGENHFAIKGFDDAGNADTKSLVITRPADQSKPGITAPVNQTVDSKQTTIKLTWKITNSRKATKIALNGKEVPVDTQVVSEEALQPGANPFTLVVTDSTGKLYSQTVVITRTVEVVRPAITPLADRSAGVDDSTTTLIWTIVDSDKAKSGTINDDPVVVGPTISQKVDLKSPSNRFILAIKDSTGGTVSDTVFVTRAFDAAGPTIVWVVPTASVSVEAGTTSLAVQIKVTDPSGVDSVYIAGTLAKKGTDDVYSYTVALPKPDGYPILVPVRAVDIKGNAKTDSSVTISRKVPDSTDKPVIKLVKPTSAKGNNVPFEESTFHVEAEITDVLLAVDASSVKFNNIAAKATGSVYAADVPVTTTGKTFTITIKASNVNGTTSTMEIEVLRAADTVKPVVAPDAATKTRSVDYSVRTIDLSWAASDNDGVDSIYFNGVSQTLAASFKKSVALALGANTFTFTAKDREGNRDSSVVTITRTADATGPELTVTSPVDGGVVAYGSKTVSVSATATDAGSGLAAIVIGTKTCTTSPCSASMALGSDGKLTIAAKDSAGNTSSKTVTVKFDTDKSAPVLVRSTGTKDMVVLSSQTSLSVSWTVTDNELMSVKINGVAATSTTNLYSAAVALTGNSQWIAIEAKDGANTSKDSIKVQRVSPPTLTAGGNSVGAKSVSISAPVGAIEYSTDGEKTWKAYTTALNLMDTTTLVARASLEGVAAKTAVTYYISQDVTLASVKVGGVSGTISGSTITVPALTTITATVSVTATATDAGATVAIGGGTSPRTVSLDYDSAVVQILVTNRASSRLYTMKIKLAAAGTFTDSRDSRTYKVVKIGTQWWMAENLKYTAGSTIGGCSNGDPTHCVTYGRNYTWAEATAEPSICPTGWHLPKSTEWKVLIASAGGDTLATTALVSKADGGTDAFGFGAVLGGLGDADNGIGGGVGWFGEYWAGYLASDDMPVDKAVAIRFWSPSNTIPVAPLDQFKTSYGSVRCVKNF